MNIGWQNAEFSSLYHCVRRLTWTCSSQWCLIIIGMSVTLNCTYDVDMTVAINRKSRPESHLLCISSLFLPQICSGISPGQLLDIRGSLERKWVAWCHCQIISPGTHICHPPIQHHCVTLTLARWADPSISRSKCGQLWKATVERCETVLLPR